jgi:predicted Zn-ribbon and HTH transcriptional regulator
MTYAELSANMSSTEFELWMGLQLVRAEECPSCGHEARDMDEYQATEARCPVCKTKYTRVISTEAIRQLEEKAKGKG